MGQKFETFSNRNSVHFDIVDNKYDFPEGFFDYELKTPLHNKYINRFVVYIFHVINQAKQSGDWRLEVNKHVQKIN